MPPISISAARGQILPGRDGCGRCYERAGCCSLAPTNNGKRHGSRPGRRAEEALAGKGRGLPAWLSYAGWIDRQVRYYYLALLHRADEAGCRAKRPRLLYDMRHVLPTN